MPTPSPLSGVYSQTSPAESDHPPTDKEWAKWMADALETVQLNEQEQHKRAPGKLPKTDADLETMRMA